VTYIEILSNFVIFWFKPLVKFSQISKKSTTRLNVTKGPHPQVEGPTPPLLVVASLTFQFH
jgi:hypothetical protein